MKIKFIPGILMALLLTTLSGWSQQLFFSDNFSNGSTLTNLTPAAPTSQSCNYDILSSKPWTPGPFLNSSGLEFGIANTSSGGIEAQAIFSPTPITLTQVGDYVQMVMVFTNVSGLVISPNQTLLGFGLYNSGQTNPILGGLNGTMTSTGSTPGGANQWAGYVGQLNVSGQTIRVMTRLPQTATTPNDQDLVNSGSSSVSYSNPSGGAIGTAVNSTLSLTAGAAYTEQLVIQYVGLNSVAITNYLYNGPTTNSPLLQAVGGVATNGTFTTSVFDSLAVGWRAVSDGQTTMDINSIQISGVQHAISSAPTITAQPTPVTVATGGYGQFSVAATGFEVSYQWYKVGGSLSADVSGANTSTLVIDPSEPGDAGQYYCVVSGFGGYTTNSVTNSLTLTTPANLVWTGNADGTTWDVNNTQNFEISGGSTPAAFIGGDAVTFDDADANGNTIVNLTGNLGPSSMYVSTASKFTFQGSGSIVGPTAVILDGQNADGQVALNTANTYTGGTVFSNNVNPVLNNYAALGNGPVYLEDPGQTMDITVAGGNTTGIGGNVVVSNNFTFQMNAPGTYATVLLGSIVGSSSATLTFNPENTGTTNRIRIYGTNTVCNANISLDPNSSPALNQAQYYGTEIAFYNGAGVQTYNGVISGSGGIIMRGNGTAVLGGQNTYTGGTTPTAGFLGVGASSSGPAGSPTSGPFGTGPIYLAPEVPSTTGSGTIISVGGAYTIGNPIVNPSVTNNLELIIDGANNITFSGPFGLNGIDASTPSTNRTVSVTNAITAFFSGAISDSGQGYGFIKTGGGALSMTNSVESYKGPTIVNGGSLLVDSTISSSSSTLVQSGGVLGGVGTVNNTVTVTNGGSVQAGDGGIGTLTLLNVNFQGGSTNIAIVNKTAGTHTLINVGTATYGGNLYVTNLAGTIGLSDSFKIFNATSESGNFTNVIGTPGPNLAWVFTPSTGMLTVTQTVVIPNIPPKITSFSFAGNNLNITATNGVNNGTYYLLGATNLLAPTPNPWTPVATNVVTASGASETFSFIGTNVINLTLPAKYFELSSTNN